MGRVILLDRDELAPGEQTYVQLRLEGPAIALPRDRFVIRSYSPVQTIGGGMVLDAQPAKHRRGETGLAANFQLLAEGSPEEIFAHHLKQAAHQGLRLSEFLPRTDLSAARLRQVAATLQRVGRARTVNADLGWYLHAEVLDALTSELRRLLEAYHRQNPLKPNISIEELRAKVRGLGDRVCLMALEELRQQGAVVVERERVRLTSHQVALDDTRERLLNELEAEFLRAGYQPPRVEELFDKLNIGKGHDKALLQVLLDQGRAVRLKENVVFHRSNLATAESLLMQYLRDHREITPIEFKDLLGISRKYAIPLLEYFDSQKLTMRVGDKRILRGVS
jgi:selenocysteine-specific elongation factor